MSAKSKFVSPRELDPIRFEGAALFADRCAMVAALALGLRSRPKVIEVGVGLGDFSQILLDVLDPSTFIAIDTFGMHHIETIWGRSREEVFGGLTHRQFFSRRFAQPIDEGRVVVAEGLSWELLAAIAPGSQDFIYVDAGHDFESVSLDLDQSLRCLATCGLIVVNDYTLYDPFLEVPYGVVQAVNELVERQDLRIAGFALERNMFCDVALVRR